MRSGTGRDRTPSRRSRTRSTAATRSSPPISTATAPTTLFYTPGTAADYVWLGSSSRTFHSTLAPPINNSYRIAAGDFNGDGYVRRALHARDRARLRDGRQRIGAFHLSPLSINGDYAVLLPGDFNGDVADDLVLFDPGTGFDELMLGGSAPGAMLTPGPQL